MWQKNHLCSSSCKIIKKIYFITFKDTNLKKLKISCHLQFVLGKELAKAQVTEWIAKLSEASFQAELSLI